MTKFTVRFTVPASRELRNIAEYIATNPYDPNPEAAIEQIKRIRSAAESLSTLATVLRVRKRDSKGRQLRQFPVNNYVLIYYVDEGKEIVRILHVFYSGRNIDSLI